MVSTIPRHPFPTENTEEGLALLRETAQEEIDALEESSTGLGDAFQTSLILAHSHCLLDPRAAIFPTWDAWVTAMQVGSAVFAAATTTEPHVQCRIAHKDRTLQATGPQWYVNPSTWINALYLAVACREKDRINALCRVPVSLLRENGSRFEEYQYAWVETLQAYWRGDMDLVRKLVAAVDATDPRSVADPETVSKIVYPPMELFHRFIRKDNAGFNQALLNALRWHKEYWSEESRALHATGLVALGPLAMVCIAYDAGMPIEGESDYLPAVLIKRNWCGEFPT
ncbi:immunity 49 family protein [Streptomyces thermoviolaceus]|uniref:immunity 49 family protein n=1 Tax=Streptomyces thermoviolaceus TaxID=1952 RepID=UPI00203B7E07|nr:immunity 49 family protein [Streptomyces thermoviolaceus]MCM3262917.1 immunity 49 family protein [Streptomyces thermoviolaceus]